MTNTFMQKARNPKEKRITISDILKEDSEDVWVVNTSDEVDVNKTKGDINIPLTTQNGESVHLRILASFIPFNLTEKISKKDLLASAAFREFMGTGRMKFLTSEMAELMLDTVEAQMEQRRLKSSERLLTIQEIKDGDRGRIENPQIQNQNNRPPENPETDGVNMIVLNAFRVPNLSENDRYLMIRNQNHLTIKDYKYVLKNAKTANLQQLASDRIKELNNQDED